MTKTKMTQSEPSKPREKGKSERPKVVANPRRADLMIEPFEEFEPQIGSKYYVDGNVFKFNYTEDELFRGEVEHTKKYEVVNLTGEKLKLKLVKGARGEFIQLSLGKYTGWFDFKGDNETPEVGLMPGKPAFKDKFEWEIKRKEGQIILSEKGKSTSEIVQDALSMMSKKYKFREGMYTWRNDARYDHLALFRSMKNVEIALATIPNDVLNTLRKLPIVFNDSPSKKTGVVQAARKCIAINSFASPEEIKKCLEAAANEV